MTTFEPYHPFTLNWHIWVSDLEVHVGHIKFARVDEHSDSITNVGGAGDWGFALPVLVQTAVVTDSDPELHERMNQITSFTVPHYETAAFWFSGDVHSVYAGWSVKGKGFGQMDIFPVNGDMHINAEFISKDTIYAILRGTNESNNAL